MRKVIEEFPDDTTPAETEGCVNDEDDDDKEKLKVQYTDIL